MREPETREVPFPSAWVTLADAMAYFDQWQGSLGLAGDFRRILYGTDEPCRPCGGLGYDPIRHVGCSACHGTGRIKTPGLVERFKQEVLGAAESDELPKSAGAAYGIVLAAEALRREIGEKPPSESGTDP